MTMHAWSQSELAAASHIAIPTVSHHLTGIRPIRDDHLRLYCAALDRTEQTQLVAAWLRDTLPGDVAINVLTAEGSRLAEEVVTWSPRLPADLRAMLEWWAAQLTADRELEEVFRIVTRRAGFEPNA